MENKQFVPYDEADPTGLVTKPIGAQTLAITGYAGGGGILNIPAEIDGKRVVSIGVKGESGAFAGNGTLCQIHMPGSIVTIEADSFKNCTALENILIPPNTVYVGKDAFAGCVKISSISSLTNEGVAYSWDKDWNSDHIQTLWSDKAGNGGVSAANSIEELLVDGVAGIAKGFASKAVSTGADIAINSILSAFGYRSGAEIFQEATTKTLQEIKELLIKQANRLSEQIGAVEGKVSEIRDQLDVIEHDILMAEDRGELGTRMSMVNQYIAKIDTLYDRYIRIAREDDYDVARAMVEGLIPEIQAADLPTMFTYMNNELTHSSAGSQTPLITLYNNYVNKVCPFAFQSAPKTNLYVEYMQGVQIKAVQLYTEYCNYMQALNNDSDAQVKMWQKNSQSSISLLEEALEAQNQLVPTMENIALHPGDDLTEFHLVNKEYDIDFYFSSVLLHIDEFIIKEDDQDGKGPNYYFGDEPVSLSYRNPVARKDYQNIDRLRIAHNVNISNSDFINQCVQINLETPMWGCKSELVPYGYTGHTWYSCPTININHPYAERRFDNGGPFYAVRVWR